MRINKLLTNLGYCSRRDANRWIEEGRITLNGNKCVLGQWIEDDDIVLVDGEVPIKKESKYLLFNKPVGIECTSDENIRESIIRYLNLPFYVFPVGRLDKDSQGLIILTNDGEFANKLLYSENRKEKSYLVTVDKIYDDDFINSMEMGVEIGGVITRKCKLKKIHDTMFEITLTQGLNRQIRKMCKKHGYNVVKLERIRIMNMELKDLKIGEYRNFTEDEIMEITKNLD